MIRSRGTLAHLEIAVGRANTKSLRTEMPMQHHLHAPQVAVGFVTGTVDCPKSLEESITSKLVAPKNGHPAAPAVSGKRKLSLDSSAAASSSSSCSSSSKQEGDALAKRRLQYKMYQRRHRARQSERLVTMEQEVHELHEEIATLTNEKEEKQKQKQKHQYSTNIFSSRGMHDGAPARLVTKLYQIFEHGRTKSQSHVQDSFLKAIMACDVKGPDFAGVEDVLAQWKLYGELFRGTHFHLSRQMQVMAFDDSTIVEVEVILTIHMTRHAVAHLFPNVKSDEVVIAQLLANPMEVVLAVKFIFDVDGSVIWCGAEADFLTGLQQIFGGSIEKVCRCVDSAKISLSTGRITPSDGHEEEDEEEGADGDSGNTTENSGPVPGPVPVPVPVPPRSHRLEMLLS